MINVRTATELFGFTMIKRVSTLYVLTTGKGYENPPSSRMKPL